MSKSIITLVMVTVVSGVCAAFIGNTIHRSSTAPGPVFVVQAGASGQTGFTGYTGQTGLTGWTGATGPTSPTGRKTNDGMKAPSGKQ